MKLKILAIVALGGGWHRGRVRRARWPAGQCVRYHPVPDRSGHHRRCQRRCRGHRDHGRRPTRTACRSARPPISPARPPAPAARRPRRPGRSRASRSRSAQRSRPARSWRPPSTTDLERDLADRQERPEQRRDPARDRPGRTRTAATTTAQIRQATMSLNNAQTQVTDAHKTRQRPARPDPPGDAQVPDRRDRHDRHVVTKGLERADGRRDRHRLDGAPGHGRCRRDRCRVDLGRPAGDRDRQRGQRAADRQGDRDRPDGGRRQHQRQRRLVPGDDLRDRRPEDGPGGHDRQHHDHHRQRDQRPDRAIGGACAARPATTRS